MSWVILLYDSRALPSCLLGHHCPLWRGNNVETLSWSSNNFVIFFFSCSKKERVAIGEVVFTIYWVIALCWVQFSLSVLHVCFPVTDEAQWLKMSELLILTVGISQRTCCPLCGVCQLEIKDTVTAVKEFWYTAGGQRIRGKTDGGRDSNVITHLLSSRKTPDTKQIHG